MLENLYNAEIFNGNIVFVSADSDVIFVSDDMGLLNVDANNVSLDNDNFNIEDSEYIIHVSFMDWCNRYKQLNKSKKEINQRINSCSMTCNTIVRLMHVRRKTKKK